MSCGHVGPSAVASSSSAAHGAGSGARRRRSPIGGAALQQYPASAYPSPRAAYVRLTTDSRFACVDAMRPIADAHGVSVAQIALAYLLQKPQVASVIIGARTDAQLADNLAAAEVRLAADEVAALDAVSALPPEYPAWMVERQRNDRYLEGMDRA